MSTTTVERLPDRERRSSAQRAHVHVRLSEEERSALHNVAAAEGLSLAALLRREVQNLIGRSA